MPAVIWAVQEFKNRVFGGEEGLRIISALVVTDRRIRERLAQGDTLRTEFVEEGREEAKQLLEGVLVSAQRDYEKRKARHYGLLFANLAFESAIDWTTANRFLREAEDLSYTQLQLLALVARRDEFPLPETYKASNELISWHAETVRQELDELGYSRKELVGMEKEGGPGSLPTNIGAPGRLVLRERAGALHSLLELETISRDELVPLAKALWEYSGLGPPETLA